MVDMSRDRFEELVDAALDQVPDALAHRVRNLAVMVADDTPPGRGELLGLYEGTPLTARDTNYAGVLPDRVTIYRNPILRICHDEDEVVQQVRVTVVHEIGHYFGIDDDRLDELGYA